MLTRRHGLCLKDRPGFCLRAIAFEVPRYFEQVCSSTSYFHNRSANSTSFAQIDASARPLAAGQCFYGLLYWYAMTPIGESVTTAISKGVVSVQRSKELARTALAKIHSTQLLHGSPSVDKIFFQGGNVRFTGFTHAVPCTQEDLQRQEKEDFEYELEILKVQHLRAPTTPLIRA